MELVGSLFLIIALAVVVALYIGRPFLFKTNPESAPGASAVEHAREHEISALMAERDRVLNSLQELDFDYSLGKIPAEEYPLQREALRQSGAAVLRKLDELTVSVEARQAGMESSAEDRIEAAVAARRADAARGEAEPTGSRQEGLAVAEGAKGKGERKDALEDLIAARKRQRKESAGGFCPGCGKPVQKSDRFCSKCGATL